MSVEINTLRFSYPATPQQVVLDIPQWSVAAGEQVFVHGPSGCGKSTLLNLISGMLPATEGEVVVLGKSLSPLSPRQLDRFRAHHIGYVFQQFNLIPYLNAIDNIQLANKFGKPEQLVDPRRIEDLLTRLNITASDARKPAGLLSIGQQQRVAIARAMINKPQLLIADEPTSSLDQVNRDQFMQELMTLVKEQAMTLLFVSHDMNLAQYFSRIDALSSINQAKR